MPDTRRPARGVALLAVLFATVVLLLASTTFLMTTQLESRIARNETRATRARLAAEAGARAVKGWFERPGAAVGFPIDPAVVLRDRAVLDETDPYGTPPVTGCAQYKEDVDHDGDGRDDLFRPPYSGDAVHRFLGPEDAPDVRIDDATYLDALSNTLFGAPPPGPAGGAVRLVRVEIFAPPYVRRETGWAPIGLATIRVVAAVASDRASVDEGPAAVRAVRLVVDRTPFAPMRLEAVHACGDATLQGPVGVRWGALVANGAIALPGGAVVPESLPRALPGPEAADRLWTADPDWVAAFNAGLDPGETLAAPWLRIIAGGSFEGAPDSSAQPWAGPPPPGPGEPPPFHCCDRSNRIQLQPDLACPRFDYRAWKRIARSGLRGAHYYAWDPSGGYREDGQGPPREFGQVFLDAAGRPGLRFFDTADSREPRDDDGDGRPDNLTPPLAVGGAWGARGFVYVHAERLVLTGVVDTLEESFRAPGEPFVGSQDAWIDLAYPADLDAPFRPAGAGTWDACGPEIRAPVAFRGLLVCAGTFEARLGGTLYGAVVARHVRLDGDAGVPTRILRDPSLEQAWPPAGWGLPRFIATGFEVE